MAWEMIAALATLFSSLALLLACVGLVRVISIRFVRRMPEIGVWMALGAQTGTILWTVLREVCALVGIGAALGISASVAALRLVQGLLFGLKRPAASLLIGSAPLDGYLPAWRAARVDPNRLSTANRAYRLFQPAQAAPG